MEQNSTTVFLSHRNFGLTCGDKLLTTCIPYLSIVIAFYNPLTFSPIQGPWKCDWQSKEFANAGAIKSDLTRHFKLPFYMEEEPSFYFNVFICFKIKPLKEWHSKLFREFVVPLFYMPEPYVFIPIYFSIWSVHI